MADKEIPDQEHPRSDLITLKEVYFHSVLLAKQSMHQFNFHENVTIQSGTDRYILLAKDMEPALFHVPGMLTHLSVTAAGAVKNRRPSSKLDEYTARWRIENEKDLHTIDEGFRTLIEKLKETSKACENIAVSSGLVESRTVFKLEDITVKVSNDNNNIFYFNRNVATRDKVPEDDGETPDFMLSFPKQGADYPSLRYPTGWNLNPMIPVSDNDALALKPENINLPRRRTLYFEMRQGCYNFEGAEGPIKQIVLIPSVIAIKVHPPSSTDLTVTQKAKERRLSC